MVTGAVVAVFAWTRRHYRKVQENLRRLDSILSSMPQSSVPARALDPKKPTAALLVGGYAGLGVHSLLTIQRLFPSYFKNFVFLSVGVIDSATFKDIAEVVEVKERTRKALDEYVALAQGLGLAATSRMALGTEAVETATQALPRGGEGVPAGAVLRREARLRAGALVPALAPQRDGLPDAAPAAVRPG